MILSGDAINRLIRAGSLVIEPLSPDTVRENGVDLRVGNQYAIYSFNDQVIDPCNLDNARDLYSIVEAKDGKIVVPPETSCSSQQRST